ncbi:MAG: hypothetical protein ACOYN4_01795 [Bacteroidales bacterium]
MNLGHINSGSSFSSTISNLLPNNKYYIRAFATILGGTLYGNQIEFATLKTGNPEIYTLSVSPGYTTADCKCFIKSDSGLSVFESGACWGINQNPSISDSHTTDGNKLGIYSTHIIGLEPNTTYYFRAYATNEKGTSYGVQKTTTTYHLSSPVVSTGEVTNITNSTATCGGNVIADGGVALTEKGVCWSISPEPTVANNHINIGSEMEAFSIDITGLSENTVYYFKAYASNSLGTSYGNQQIFKTLSCGSPITIYHQTGNIAPVTKTVVYGTVTNMPGEISKCWITSNLGATHQATSQTDATESSAGWYWQFNRKQGFLNGGIDPTPSWTITNISETSDWTSANDPCTIELGNDWRIPTATEWSNVLSNGAWVDLNSTWNSKMNHLAASGRGI